MNNLNNKKILLIICGGIAAYKSLEIIRLLKKSGVIIKTILTENGAKFVGEWKNDQMHGHGSMFYPSGESYIGGYKESKVPKHYTLNKGHVYFFYNKGLYLHKRYDSIICEMKKRGFKP